MPEAAMDKNDLPPRRKDQIGCAGQSFVMQDIAVAQSVQEPANSHFRCSVHRPDSGHELVPILFGELVHIGEHSYVLDANQLRVQCPISCMAREHGDSAYASQKAQIEGKMSESKDFTNQRTQRGLSICSALVQRVWSSAKRASEALLRTP